MLRLLLGIALFGCAAGAAGNPLGRWQTVDDATDQVTGIVEITEHDGHFEGRIVQILDPEAPADAICQRCTDERRNAPIVGLTIIRNVKSNDRPNGPWDDGDILDPKNGRIYSVRLALADKGRTLEVRGYLGSPWLGRTQVWRRAD